MNFDYAEHRRDRRLRKRLLQALHAVRVRPEGGWVTGRFAFDLVDGAQPGGERFESDIHALGLLRDLVNSHYAQERDDRPTREPFTLESVSYRVTAAGTAVVLELTDPDPLLEDSRDRPRRSPDWATGV
ncbi:hypothetical protein [Humisphaera borealis]|uniref:Uncharacterized protein n=1 Tax=Humisphaera borealis TaxID=2807512 RepID=A0A7M2X3Q5_9BACT|nr:hypothetical protein [Humisphaera borealis]QOV91641.1 hypothetical protein IPV69_09865 [Humisphaera borealis]